MAKPFSIGSKSLHEQAIECVIKATESAERNQQDQVKMYTQQAKMLAELTARKMRAMGMHREADEYLKNLTEHINRVWSIAQRTHADRARGLVEKAKRAVVSINKADADKKSCKCQREKSVEKDNVSPACQCGGLDKALKKGSLNPFVSEHPARQEFSLKGGSISGSMSVGAIKSDPRYSYKMMHELSPQHQADVQKKFPSDHSKYAYPVHRETGELKNGERVPLPPGHALRAQAYSFRELKPEHQKGAFVEINAPGHSSHGKKGVVMGSNPNLPGKLQIQTGPTEHHSIYAEPHQLKLSRATSRVEKAIQTIFNIRKAFFK